MGTQFDPPLASLAQSPTQSWQAVRTGGVKDPEGQLGRTVGVCLYEREPIKSSVILKKK